MKLAGIFIAAGVALAKTAVQIVNEVNTVEQYTSQLQDLVANFEGDICTKSSYFHNMKTINTFYKINTYLGDSMVTVTESMENNCDCSYGDSKKIVEALGRINCPIRKTLSAYEEKRNEFYAAYGVYITDHIIVSAIKRWRVLTLNLLNNVRAKTDPEFSRLLSCGMADFDRRYRNTLGLYMGRGECGCDDNE